MNMSRGLPQINSKPSQEEATNKSRRKNAMDIFKHDNKNNLTDVPILKSGVLYAAPSNLFTDLEPIVHTLTTKVQDELGKGEHSAMISAVHKHPMDEVARKNALNLVVRELVKAENTLDHESIAAIRILDEDTKKVMRALVINEIIGLGPLEPLWKDYNVTEIMVNGPYDVQVEIQGSVTKVPSVRFRDVPHLKSLITRLYNSTNKEFSPTSPGEKARLHDNSRLHAVHEVVCPDGPNFNIRKHTKNYWTPIDIVAQGTCSKEVMTDFGNFVNAGASVLIIGSTGSGKTTMLNAITGFYDSDVRLVTLEKNLELKPHPKKLFAAPMETITGKPGSLNPEGVTMRRLVEYAMQMRPDGIIIGEVTDGAAYDLCQALNTGHFGASTIHANSIEDGINRLVSLVSQDEVVKGDAVYNIIASAFDLIVQVDRSKTDGVRRIVEIAEVDRKPTLDKETGKLTVKVRTIWKIKKVESIDDEGSIRNEVMWEKVNDLSPYTKDKLDIADNKLLSWEELVELSSV